tara:strand:- start:82 stop:765 length:684 start_codon:yes stop_codon:yes gene_type:complete
LIIAILGNVVPFNLISWSEVYVDSLVASTLIGTMPIFTFLLSLYFFKTKTQKNNVYLGIALGFLGMYIFINPDESISNNKHIFFSLLIIVSSMFYAFSANWVKTLKNQSSIELAFCSIAVATIICIPTIFIYFLSQNDPINLIFSKITFSSMISATILGILCTGLAITVFFKLIETENAVFASQSNYLIPCFGFLWSYIFMDERLTINLFVGLTMIVYGAFLVNKKV